MEVWEVGEHWNGVIITGMFAGRTQERSAFVLRSAFSSQISVDAHTHTHRIPGTWIYPLLLRGEAVRVPCEGIQAPHIYWLGRRCVCSPLYREIKACRRTLLVPEHPSKGREIKEKKHLPFHPSSIQVENVYLHFCLISQVIWKQWPVCPFLLMLFEVKQQFLLEIGHSV